ncbi:Orf y, partial [Tanacetum coccineum]
TTGITSIPGERRSIEELEGMSWHLKPPEQTSVRVPSRVAVNERLNRSESAYKLLKRNISLMTYDAPPDITPIEEVAATGWGDEFSDNEVTPGKVTILEERSDWDDDERSGGKVLVIKERLVQNQQEFLNEYLSQRDEHLAIQKQESETDYQFGYPQGKRKIFNGGYGEYYNSQWTLPPAWTESRVILVLLANPGLWSKVISRWESITINRLNNQTWSDNKATLAFVENLLGESEKLMWQQWRTAYPGTYSALEAIADEPQNITSQVRQQLATKSGRLYFPSTTEKLFAKLPPSLSKRIEESFRAKHPGLSSGVLPAIKFTHTFVSEICKDAALAKELRDLSLCSAIPIPGYYKNNMKKYGMRKSKTYKGKPHNSHVKPFKRKYKDDRGRVKKCKCFICGKEGHFVKDCRSKQGNIARSAIYQELDLDDNWDIVSADFDDSSMFLYVIKILFFPVGEFRFERMVFLPATSALKGSYFYR